MKKAWKEIIVLFFFFFLFPFSSLPSLQYHIILMQKKNTSAKNISAESS